MNILLWCTIKKWAGKLFGFQREIDELRRRVVELSWDYSFGMWTRQAFLEFCRVMPRGLRTIAFIDLNDIHTLNYHYSYIEVDRRIHTTFSIPFRRSDIVARWYSGDEIVILFDSDRTGAEWKISELREAARRSGLTFVCALGEWEVGRQPIEEIIATLSQHTVQEKLVNSPTTLLEPA